MLNRNERRGSSRSPVNLPLEYRFPSSPCIHAGMVVNAGEDGLLMESNKQIPIGAILNITVLFPERKELACVEASVEVIRRESACSGKRKSFFYGVKLDERTDTCRERFNRLLLGRFDWKSLPLPHEFQAVIREQGEKS